MQARDVARTSFVVVAAGQSVELTRELIQELDPTHLVVRRGGAAGAYYLFSRDEVPNGMKAEAEDAQIDVALGLDNAAATPVIEASADAEWIPDRCLIQEDGMIIGFFDALVKPTRGGARRGRPETEPAAGAEAPGRSLTAELPERVALGAVAPLLVLLSAGEAPAGGLAVGDLPVGSVIDVLVQARRGFVLEGTGQGALTVTDDREGLPLLFKVRATALGPGELRVFAFHAGLALGIIRLTPTVVEAAALGAVGPTRPTEQPLAPVTVQLPDLSLLIEEARVDGRRGFSLHLTATDPRYNLNLAKFGPVLFETDPGRYFRGLYDDIEGYALATEEDRAVAAQRLADKGTALFEDLIPPEARRVLWSLREEIKTVMVQSEEPWIPWELCKLYGEEGGEIVEGPFFGEAFAVTRWKPGIGLKPTLSLGNLAIVVPEDSQLPCAREERDYLLSLAGDKRIVTTVPARFVALRRALASGRHDGWHFTGHGASPAEDPDRNLLYLEQGQSLTPDSIAGAVANLGKARPLVFLNACQVGRGGLALTGVGGWAQRFLAAGAGAFVGAYWAVFDQAACAFARELYSRLLAGVPIGRAAQEARLAIKATGDPTWLAYTVFAHPLATVR